MTPFPFQLGITLHLSVPGRHRVFALSLEELFRIDSRSDPGKKRKRLALILSPRVLSLAAGTLCITIAANIAKATSLSFDV